MMIRKIDFVTSSIPFKYSFIDESNSNIALFKAISHYNDCKRLYDEALIEEDKKYALEEIEEANRNIQCVKLRIEELSKERINNKKYID